MTTSAKPPEYLTFQCRLTIEAVEGVEGADKQMPRFHLVAYTGGLMRIAGFPHPVVVDLEGLAIERQDIPVRLDHNPRQGVGHTQRVAIENGQVVAEGLISRDTSWARDVAKSGVNGFPWQASIGAAVIEAQFIRNGQTVSVNGRTFTGPVHVVREAVLKEISFVDSGADTQTSARIAARLNAPESAKGKETDSMDGTDVSTATQDLSAVPGTAQAGADVQDAPADAQDAPKPDVTPVSESTGPEPDAAPAAEPKPEPTPETPATVEAAAEPDPVIEMRRRMAAETRRVDAIRRLCAGKHADIEAKAIEDGWDETKTELHVLRASRPKPPVVSAPKRPSGPQVFEAVALMASGFPMSRIEAAYAEPILEGAERLRGVGVQEFCELACGQQLPRYRRDATGWLQAAFSTASLPGILSNIANKMLLEGYNYIEDAWRRIAKIASVNDFKEHSRYRLTGAFKFEQVGPDGELKHGKLDEQKFGQRADTHGIMFALNATFGRTEYEVQDDYGLTVGAEVMDFLILAEEFPFDEPEAGDQVIAYGVVYEVMSLAGQGHWRWSDPYRTTMRIHAKEVGTE